MGSNGFNSVGVGSNGFEWLFLLLDGMGLDSSGTGFSGLVVQFRFKRVASGAPIGAEIRIESEAK